MSKLTAKPMVVNHAPGWTVEPSDSRLYMLWAPREAETMTTSSGTRWERPARAFWQSSWHRRNGAAGGGLRGATMAEVLDVFPTDAEGRQARRLLEAAARDAHLEGVEDEAPA